MKFINVISIVFAITLLSACSNNTQKVRLHIVNKNVKYWYRYHKDASKPYSLGYCFNEDGSYIYYCIIKDSNRTVRAIINSPNLPKQIWRIMNDTVLMFGQDTYYNITAINDDSIVLNMLYPNDKEFFKLHIDTDQNTKPENFVYWDTVAPPTM